MLQIREQTPERLVVEDRQPVAGFFAGLFTLLSALIFVTLLIQVIDTLVLGEGKDLMAWRYLGSVIFLLITLSFVLLGVVVTLHFAWGTRCVFDKKAETLILSRVQLFRRRHHDHAIYSVARLEVEHNDEMRAYGLFLVLRSGERLPLGAFNQIDSEAMQPLVTEIRAFLRTVGGQRTAPEL